MLTVTEILTARAFNKATILAGKDGLDRQISSVTVAEVPDAANWLHGGELVCTTAYFIRQGLKHQIPWFESLIKGGAVAVAIKTSRFLHSIPQPIIDIAERYRIPLIELPPEITWPTVIEAVMQLLSNEQSKLIHSSADIHRKLIDFVLNNASVDVIANEIATLTDQPVIIEDVHLNTITYANISSHPLFTTRLEDQVKTIIRNSQYYQDVLRGVVKEKTELFLREEPLLRNLMVPIISNQTVYGFLSILNAEKSYRLLDGIVLENGAVALSLLFMRQRIAEQTVQSKTTSLIQDLINGRINTSLIRDPLFTYMDWSNPLYVVVLETFSANEARYDIWNRTHGIVQQVIQSELNRSFFHYLIGFNGSAVTIFVSVPPKILNQASSMLAEMTTGAIKALKTRFNNSTFNAGISRICPNLAGLSKSYKEASEALSISKSFPKVGRVVLFEQMGIPRLLSLIPDVKEIRAFTDDFLSSIKKYDLEHKDKLTKTLHVYLTQNGNINKTAKALFVHPNTVLYRMKKIQSILGRDLDSTDMRLTYLIALESDQMLGRE